MFALWKILYYNVPVEIENWVRFAMCNYDLNFMFYSHNNFVLGSRLREFFRKLGIELSYCGDVEELVVNLQNYPNTVLFFGGEQSGYASFLSRVLHSDLYLTRDCKFVFVDDNLDLYAPYVNNVNFFSIPETNLEIALYNTIAKCELQTLPKEDLDYNKINKMISGALCKLGFSYKLVGFNYLKQSIEQVVKNNFVIGSLTKDVYPYIAIANNTSESNVERSIRKAIDAAYIKSKFDVEGYEALREHRCSNRFFISCLVDKLTNELNNNAG